ncbi:MAG: hypothetical protein AAB710_02000, partial [Patescibacteria group bacterium]
RKGETFKEREGEPTLSPAPTAGPRSWGKDRDASIADMLRQRQQKRLTRYAFFATITLGVIALASAAVFFVFLREGASVTKENIFLSIEAPTRITVGEEVTYEVRFQNQNAIPLESVDLIFEFPEGARPVFGSEPPRGSLRERVTIGRLLPQEEQRETFTAFLFGKEGDVLEAKATLEYRPQNTSARFGKDAVFSVSVDRSPIGVAINMPDDATSGQEIEITLDYVSTTESLLKNVSLDMLYPPGFTFNSATPPPSKDNNLWQIGALQPNAEGHIVIHGVVAGNPEESKYFLVRMGLLEETTENWSIYGQASRLLTIRDTLLAVEVMPSDGSHAVVEAGESGKFILRWRNNLPVSARNVIVEAVISGKAVNYAGIRARSGTYNGAEHKVIWTASQEPAFRFVAPGASGELDLQVPVMKTLPINTLQDKNFEIRVDAVMYTNTVPEGFSGVETSGKGSAVAKVLTQADLVSRGLYRSGVFKNIGPLPPRVGQETTYTITWSITSSVNDLEGAVVRSSIPAYVQWKGLIKPEGEHVVYDPDTREITWDVGFIVAGTGYTRPAREVSFQLGIIPGVNQVGDTPIIIHSAAMSGKDVFTDTAVQRTGSEVTTALRNDPLVTNQTVPHSQQLSPLGKSSP